MNILVSQVPFYISSLLSVLVRWFANRENVIIGFCTSLPQDAYSSFQEKTLIHNDVFLGIWKHVVGLIRVSLRQNRALGESEV